jgi:hypothetical protein
MIVKVASVDDFVIETKYARQDNIIVSSFNNVLE